MDYIISSYQSILLYFMLNPDNKCVSYLLIFRRHYDDYAFKKNINRSKGVSVGILQAGGGGG